MQIESLIRRKGGTRVLLDGAVYHFDTAEGFGEAHVADVSDDDHAGRLLGIPEGYRIARKGGAAQTAPAPAPEPALAPVPAPVPEPQAEPAPPVAAVGAITAARIDAMDTGAMVALFEKIEGRKPHPSIKPETLRDKLKEIALD